MSFLDNLAKNLSSKTEFFTQLSNLSSNLEKNSRASFAVEAKKTASAREAGNDDLSNSKDDFKVEKQDYFSTAKKVFKEYKVKAEKNSSTKTKTKDVEDQEETEEALDALFGLVEQKVEEKDPSQLVEVETLTDLPLDGLAPELGLDEIKVEEIKTETGINPDPELLDFFLGKIEHKLNDKVEELTKEIVKLDLNSEEGVAEILEISNKIEQLQNLSEEIKKIEIPVELTDSDIELSPELEKLIETKLDTKLENLEAKLDRLSEKLTAKKPELDIKLDTKANENLDLKADSNKEADTKIKDVLDRVRASIEQSKAIKEPSSDKANSKAELASGFHVKVLEEVKAKVENTKQVEFNQAEVEVLELDEANSGETQQGNDFSNDNFETLFPKAIKVSNVNVKTLSKPVAIKQLPELITKETENVKANSKQEIKMLLDPENLGRMQLNITKEDNQIHISMIVRSDEALSKLEQKINDIKLALKDKGFESNIEVNKSDTNNSAESGQSQGHNKQDNEAKEKQKEKFLNQVPEWISNDVQNFDFKDALNRAL